MTKGPIAIFDSGYGGLTVLNEICRQLPQYDYIYLGDNARNPYGTRSFDVVYDYTLQAVEKLFEMDAQLVILACNTASAKALRNIQQKDLPTLAPDRRVLGVIRPSVEIIDGLSNSKHVGVLATPGTVQSESYLMEISKLYPHLMVTQCACPMWVPLVENNEFDKPGADYYVKLYVDELLSKDPKIDTIILGCTHYPMLLPKIQQYLPGGINVVEQGSIVANSLSDYLQRHSEMEERCTKNGTVKLFTTENELKFKQTAGIFFKDDLTVKRVLLH